MVLYLFNQNSCLLKNLKWSQMTYRFNSLSILFTVVFCFFNPLITIIVNKRQNETYILS